MTNANLIAKAWLRSHEEETGDAQVFRPADHDFPPSRGRYGFDLREDGTGEFTGPGPVDRGERQPARWSLADDLLRIAGGDREEEYEVRLIQDDRLVLVRRE